MKQHAIQKILSPIDFSPVSLAAVQTAVDICKRQFATLTLIHVVEINHTVMPAMRGIPYGNVLPELIEVATANMNQLARKIRLEHDMVVDHVVQSGTPADQINLWATAQDIDLIVMGTQGLSRWREFFMGSTTFCVIKMAPCAVLSVPGHFHAISFKKVLFPLRVIPNALEKYDAVRPIIQRNKSRLLIAGMLAKTNQQGLLKMQTLVETLKSQAAEDGVNFSVELHQCDDIGRQVLALAHLENPDLIVITATLNSAWQNLYEGTFVKEIQEIVNHAKYPVLSIPAATLDV